MNLCKCGCGKECKLSYCKGHARKGKAMTEEHKQKISLKNKGKKLSNEHIELLRKINIGRKKTEAEKLKISDSAKKNGIGKWMIGRKQSPEAIEKMRLKRIGSICAEKTKQKISQANKKEKNGMFGKTHTLEAKNKISKTAKNMWQRPGFKDRCKTQAFRKRMQVNRNKMIVPVKDSIIEIIVKNFLDELCLKYLQHKYIKEIEHSYQSDFLLIDEKIIIECDGIYWHQYPIGREIDHLRTKELIDAGYKVIRLWEHEILKMNITDFINILKYNDKTSLNQKNNISGFDNKLKRCISMFKNNEVN